MTGPGSIDSYLKNLSAITSVSDAAKDRLLAEVEDHLRQAAAEAVTAGASLAQAEQDAIDRFGSVQVIADRAGLAEAVARGRRRIRGALLRTSVSSALVIILVALALVRDQGPLNLALAVFLIGCSLSFTLLRVRMAQWGLAPQLELEATLDRETRAWFRNVRTLRYQLTAIAIFYLIWSPWRYIADHSGHRAPPWQVAWAFGFIAVIVGISWLRQRRMQARAEHEMRELPT